MVLSEFIDPYLDPCTGIFRNKVGAKTQEELYKAETDLLVVRCLRVFQHPPEPTGDLSELCAIHYLLFQDVFDWAGQIRTVDIRKNEQGSEFFVPVRLIERTSHMVAVELFTDNMLRGLSRDRFIERLAHHYDQLNYIHPFREGNGRAQRVFWSRVARDAAWQLNWREVQGEVNDLACKVACEQRDLSLLEEMFDRIVAPLNPQIRQGHNWYEEEGKRLSI